MPDLRIPHRADRDELASLIAHAVQLDHGVLIRLRGRDDRVDAWVATPFEVLVTRSVTGAVSPPDVTVAGPSLLAGLAVVGGEVTDPGHPQDVRWRAELPPAEGWLDVDDVPAALLAELADGAAAAAADQPGRDGLPPAALLDRPEITVTGAGLTVPVPVRCLFALTAMGLVGGRDDGGATVRVRATDAWLRLDALGGSVLRRRRALLPLLV